jgi:hypothetical protein
LVWSGCFHLSLLVFQKADFSVQLLSVENREKGLNYFQKYFEPGFCRDLSTGNLWTRGPARVFLDARNFQRWLCQNGGQECPRSNWPIIRMNAWAKRFHNTQPVRSIW